MPENRKSALKRLWTTEGAPADRPALAFARVYLVTAVINGLMLVLIPAAFLSALFLHLRSLAAAGIVMLAVVMASYGVLEAFRIRWVMNLGRWTGWKREPISRNEQPIRYWSWTAIHAVILAVYLAAAVFLIWSDLSWMARR
jgi:hypothetical protein